MATDDVTGRGDRLGRRTGFPLWPGRRGKRLRTAVIGVVLAGYAWAAGAAAPLTTTSLVFVLIPGVVLDAIAYAWPPERIPPPAKLDTTGMFWWVIAVAALFEWEFSVYKDDSHPYLHSFTTRRRS